MKIKPRFWTLLAIAAPILIDGWLKLHYLDGFFKSTWQYVNGSYPRWIIISLALAAAALVDLYISWANRIIDRAGAQKERTYQLQESRLLKTIDIMSNAMSIATRLMFICGKLTVRRFHEHDVKLLAKTLDVDDQHVKDHVVYVDEGKDALFLDDKSPCPLSDRLLCCWSLPFKGIRMEIWRA